MDEAAVRDLGRALKPSPLELADRALSTGQFSEAERLGLLALQSEPENPAALLIVGITFVRTGRTDEALPYLARATHDDATAGPSWLWLSRAHRKLGKTIEALVSAEKAVQRMPNHGPASFQLGISQLETNDYLAAAQSLERAAALDPNAPTVQHALGLALQGLGQNAGAIQCFRKAVSMAPRSQEFLESLFQALLDESDSTGAVVCARTLLDSQPEDAHSHLRMARALLANNEPDEAEAHLERALSCGPREGNFCFAAGAVLQSLGRIEDATAQFLRSIELLPDQGFAYSALAYNRRTTDLDRPLVDQMRWLSEKSELSVQARSHLNYAVGRSLEQLGDYEQAMAHFDKANQLSYETKFGSRAFDRQLYEDRVDINIQRSKNLTFTDSEPAEKSPIFVVGMLRSGTTLVDQILSSHPDVGSAGEQGFWLHRRDEPWSKDGTSLDRAKLRKLAEQYLEGLAKIAPNSRYIVDKMPDNYLEAPLLHAAFPRAKIVHVRRNPADTGISIYTTINRLRVGWSHTKEDIVFAYRQYERVMDEWRKLLPPGVIFELQYEELVENQERITRELVAFCGLDWNDACLHPESNRRSVVTPSVWQVRQPLYGTSIGRWRRYEPWLGEFAALLSPRSVAQ